MNNKIEIIFGDITSIAVEAIVNAANSSLLGGGGVDGAIHRAGGKTILEQCQQIRAKQGRCEVGKAVITSAGLLPAKYVIHTVGPCWSGGNNNERELLQSCYLSCFQLMAAHTITSVSFPNISTGVYRFPKDLAAKIALTTIKQSLAANSVIKKVNIVCFEMDNYQLYQSLIAQ